MRKLGLDYGDKTVGVALSDESLLLAQPIITLTRNNPIDIKSTVDELVKIIDENEVDEVVIGLPVNMDGSEGERVDKTKWFAKKLSKKTSVPINFWDDFTCTTKPMRCRLPGCIFHFYNGHGTPWVYQMGMAIQFYFNKDI